MTGAALLRERRHGTIKRLAVMPLNAVQIVMTEIWANGLTILIAFTLSMFLVVENILNIPVAGSKLLLGTSAYLFTAAAIGIFLGTIAQTMAQFALLVLMVIIPMVMLS